MTEKRLEQGPLVEDQQSAILNALLDRRRAFYESSHLGRWIAQKKGVPRLNIDRYQQRSEKVLAVLLSEQENNSQTKISKQTQKDLKFIRRLHPEEEKLKELAQETLAAPHLEFANSHEAEVAKQFNQLPLSDLIEKLGVAAPVANASQETSSWATRRREILKWIVGLRTNEVATLLLTVRECFQGRLEEAKILLTVVERRLGSILKADDRQTAQRLFWQVKGEYLQKVNPSSPVENLLTLRFAGLVKKYEDLQIAIDKAKEMGDKNRLAVLYQENYRLISELGRRTNFAFGKLETLKIQPKDKYNQHEWRKAGDFWRQSLIEAHFAIPRIVDQEAKNYIVALLAKNLVLFENCTGERITF